MSHPYTPASKTHTSRIPAHVATFRRVVGAHFGYTRTEVVRDASRCARQASRHCQCEAIDFFTTDLRPTGPGRRLFEWCHKHGHDLDVQGVIFNRRVVGFGKWDQGERPYTGSHPHTDHVHVEFSARAKSTLTEEKIRRLLGGEDMPLSDEDVAKVVNAIRGMHLKDPRPDVGLDAPFLLAFGHMYAHVNANHKLLQDAHTTLDRIESKLDAMPNAPDQTAAVKAIRDDVKAIRSRLESA